MNWEVKRIKEIAFWEEKLMVAEIEGADAEKIETYKDLVEESKERYARELLIHKIANILLILIFAIFVGVIVYLSVLNYNLHSPSSSGSPGSSGNTITCNSCGRSFDSSSSNGRSIKSTGMCNNCYSNFKYIYPNATLHISSASANKIYCFLHNDCDNEVWFNDIKAKASLNRIMITGSNNI